MKSILTSVFCMITLVSTSQSETGRLGFAINSSYWDRPSSFSIMPMVTFTKNNHQVELGFGAHPFAWGSARVLSSEFNYKYYPNGIENRFNMYLMTNFTHSNILVSQDFTVRSNLFFLNGGYGFEIKLLKNAYVGTNFNLGLQTQSRYSENAGYIWNEKVFDDVSLSAAVRIGIGYRF